MADGNDPVGAGAGVTTRPETVTEFLIRASNELAEARQKSAEAFLLAKLSSRKPTDRQAEASAEVEAGEVLTAAETMYFIAKEQFAAALRQGGK
jgi:hypothetical protein